VRNLINFALGGQIHVGCMPGQGSTVAMPLIAHEVRRATG